MKKIINNFFGFFGLSLRKTKNWRLLSEFEK